MTVTSSGFPIEGDYLIMWSTSPKFDSGKTVTIKSGSLPNGSLALTESFNIPESPMGLYYVGFIRPGREESYPPFSYSVVPRIKVQPVQVTPGATVTVYGSGLPADDTDILSFDGKALTMNITSNKSGSFSIDYMVPATIAGEHQFTVSSTKVSAGIPAAILVVTPSITLSTNARMRGRV